MCGIVGVIHADSTSSSAAADIHDALYMLQHRGQDACGIATCASGGRIHQCKGNGMAARVFHEGDRVNDLPGYMGVGHLRYPTAGTSANAEAQPFYVNSPYGLSLCHNGNLINSLELKQLLDQELRRHVNTDSDSELMLNILAHELNSIGKPRVTAEDVFTSLERTYEKCKGGWACTAMIAGFGLIAFRDPYGIRPLILGSRTISEEAGTDYMIASESVALQGFGCDPSAIVDIKPGEAVIIQKGHLPRFYQVQQPITYSPDIFEYVYFARPDSVIDGISVYKARENMGIKLAAKIKDTLAPEVLEAIDAIIPIPETSNTSARCLAKYLGKELVEGFIKNRYIFRTFIMPNQKLRRTGVRRKLNPMRSAFEGKNVLLIDDSIVRGNTCSTIVSMARESGAKQIILCSCAPPITHQHIYGIDLASSSELIAHHKSNEEIAREIGADGVIYQSLPDLVTACAEASPRGRNQRFEVGVFNGEYVTPVPPGYFEHLDKLRGKKKKTKAGDGAKRPVANNIAFVDQKQKLDRGMPAATPTFVLPHHTNGAVIPGGNSLNGSLKSSAATTPFDQGTGSAWEWETQDIALYNVNDHTGSNH